MSRPPVTPAEKKIRIVLAVIAGDVRIAEAARKERVSEQSIGRWKAEFLEAGKGSVHERHTECPSSRQEAIDGRAIG